MKIGDKQVSDKIFNNHKHLNLYSLSNIIWIVKIFTELIFVFVLVAGVNLLSGAASINEEASGNRGSNEKESEDPENPPMTMDGSGEGHQFEGFIVAKTLRNVRKFNVCLVVEGCGTGELVFIEYSCVEFPGVPGRRGIESMNQPSDGAITREWISLKIEAANRFPVH